MRKSAAKKETRMIKVTLYLRKSQRDGLNELSARTHAPASHYVREAVDAALEKARAAGAR